MAGTIYGLESLQIEFLYGQRQFPEQGEQGTEHF